MAQSRDYVIFIKCSSNYFKLKLSNVLLSAHKIIICKIINPECELENEMVGERIFVLAICFLLSIPAFAQTTKGTYFTGGDSLNIIVSGNIHRQRTPVTNSAFISVEKQMIDGTYWNTYSDINIPRFATVLSSMVIVDAILQKKQSEYWYTKQRVKFHGVDFFMDFDRYKQMDKFGHFTDSYFVSDLASKTYRWSGLSGTSSVLFGALTGWLWTLQIELYDARSPSWGWSWGDILSNTIGSGFFVIQQLNYNVLGGIQPKFSYHLSEEWARYGSKKVGNNLIQDYGGMTFWLAVNPFHYFPDSWKKVYPEWLVPLGLAFGFGVNGVFFDSLAGEREIFIGLDIDLRKIPLGDDIGILKFLKSELNFIRLPLPAVRITPGGVWYGLYF